MADEGRGDTIAKVRADAEKSCSRWEEAYTDLQAQYALVSGQLEEARQTRNAPLDPPWHTHARDKTHATTALDALAREGGLLAAALGCFPERLARFLAFRHLSLFTVNRALKTLFRAKEAQMLRVIGTRRERALRGIVIATNSSLKKAVDETGRQKHYIQELESEKAELDRDGAGSARDAQRLLREAQLACENKKSAQILELERAKDDYVKLQALSSERFQESEARYQTEIEQTDGELEEMCVQLDKASRTRAEAVEPDPEGTQALAAKSLRELEARHKREMDAKDEDLEQLRVLLERAGNVGGDGHVQGTKTTVEFEELQFELVTAKYHAGRKAREVEVKASELEDVLKRLAVLEFQADSRAKEMQQKDAALEELRFQLKTYEHKSTLLAEELEAKDAELERAREFSSSYLSTLRYKTIGTYPSISARATPLFKDRPESNMVNDVVPDTPVPYRDVDEQAHSQGAISIKPMLEQQETVYWDDCMFAAALARRQGMSDPCSGQNMPVASAHVSASDPDVGNSWYSSFALLFAQTETEKSKSPFRLTDDHDQSSSHRAVTPPPVRRRVMTPSPELRTSMSAQRSAHVSHLSATTARSTPRKNTMIPMGRNGLMIRCPCSMMPPGDTSISCDCSVQPVPYGSPISKDSSRSPNRSGRE